jgi:hypothetical protein
MASSFKNTLKFVTNYANQVEAEIETRLHNNKKVASGDLYDSIGYTITETPTRISLSFVMDDYGKFVDKGVNGYMNGWGSPYSFKPKNGKGSGKSKFISELQRWCVIRGLPKGAAFPIRKNIWKNGIAPTNFFTLPTTRRLKQFNEGVKKNMALDIEAQIQKDLKEQKVKYKKR